MDSNHLQHITSGDKASVDNKQHEDGKKLLKQLHHQGNKESQSQPVSFSPASPPSASSSPSHEFSFTISLQNSSSNTTTTTTTIPADKATNNNKPPASFAIDLSPADDIFFHGHLLPLHLLSHLPVSPRSSTNSMDSFTLPTKDLLDDQKPTKESNINCSTTTSTTSHNNSNKKTSSSKQSQISSNNNINSDETMNGGRSNKPKSSFSFLGFTRWRKGCEEVSEIREDKEEKQKRKLLRFDLSQVVKRYMRMVQSLLFFKGRRDNMRLHRQAYSFSGNLALRNNKPADLRGRRGEFSAPASMRTSPSNSGLLVATATLPSSTSDSTMEELQAAIQAAIAHCKNSIASDDKLKC